MKIVAAQPNQVIPSGVTFNRNIVLANGSTNRATERRALALSSTINSSTVNWPLIFVGI